MFYFSYKSLATPRNPGAASFILLPWPGASIHDGFLVSEASRREKTLDECGSGWSWVLFSVITKSIHRAK